MVYRYACKMPAITDMSAAPAAPATPAPAPPETSAALSVFGSCFLGKRIDLLSEGEDPTIHARVQKPKNELVRFSVRAKSARSLGVSISTGAPFLQLDVDQGECSKVLSSSFGAIRAEYIMSSETDECEVVYDLTVIGTALNWSEAEQKTSAISIQTGSVKRTLNVEVDLHPYVSCEKTKRTVQLCRGDCAEGSSGQSGTEIDHLTSNGDIKYTVRLSARDTDGFLVEDKPADVSVKMAFEVGNGDAVSVIILLTF